MPNKLTDAEIKKALEFLKSKTKEYCEQCAYKNIEVCDICIFGKIELALDLINRQEDKCKAYKYYYDECLKDLKNANAENERLTIRLKKVEHQLDDALKMGEIINAENVSLKAEVERLQSHIQEGIDLAKQIPEMLSLAKAEAYKEFAERIDKEFIGVGTCNYGYIHHKTRKVLKELVGDSANIDKQN